MATLAYTTLALVPGIGRSRLQALIARFGSAERALDASLAALQDAPGISRAAATAIRGASRERTRRLFGGLRRVGGAALAPDDADFPRFLREIPDAPSLLFVAGRADLLHRPAVAIVGSRSHTRYGADVCRHFAGGLVRHGVTVVSGMARGIDAIAHAAALDAGGTTAGILGNGLGIVYPAANRSLYERVASHGCLVTEHPPGERPHAGSFPKRNRLISGLARATVVIEAGQRSGALITVDCALAQGREVLAVPGPVTSCQSAGCNCLIQLGAKPALGLRDILEECDLPFSGAPAISIPKDLSNRERQVMSLLSDGRRHVDEVASAVNAPLATVLATLTSLEVRGLVAQSPGKHFEVHTCLGWQDEMLNRPLPGCVPARGRS